MSELYLLDKLKNFLNQMDTQEFYGGSSYEEGKESATECWAERLRELIEEHNKSRLGL